MKTFLLTLFLAVAACGGGSKKPATEPKPDPVTTPEPTEPAEAVKTEPATPAEPAAPAAPDPAQIKTDLLAAETTAFEKAKPVFGKFCSGCHQKGQKNASKKKLEEFDMTSYPFGGKHAKDIGKEIREVLGIGGGKPTMPKTKPGAVKGDDLAAIAAWADAWEAADKGGAHETK